MVKPSSIVIKGRRAVEVLLIVVFVTLILAPSLDTCLHLDKSSAPEEKRAPASFPLFKSEKGIAGYVVGLEKYFNDHFGFRRQLIHWNNHWKLAAFHESSTGKVILGQDGWAYWAEDRTIEHYTGVLRFNERDLRDWQKLLETRRNRAEKMGAKYLFVIVPSKATIYPEHLPTWLVKSDKPTKLDQFFEFMKLHSTVPTLDLRPPLLEAKKQGTLYLETDTHWNELGAFIGYQALINELARQMAGLTPKSLGNFDQRRLVDKGGDCAAVLGEQEEVKQEYLIFTPRPPLPPLKISRGGDYRNRHYPPPAKMHHPDLFISDFNQAQGKAIMFHDSFAGHWLPFFGYHFQQVIYYWQFPWDVEFIEREKPDVIVDEIFEGWFNLANPRQVLADESKSVPVAH